ncbi:MAG: ribosome-associated translation inhibitor RaiA [Candidatus Pacebacteria bacterium]|nr:ribosome-associated translation inhibitor RaiA [Candidatus Paceibacterota bacterium]
MRLDIELKNLDSTPSIKEYIEERILALDQYTKRWEEEGAVSAKFELARTTNHHHKGRVYYAEINLTMGGKFLRAEDEGDDVHAVIDKVKDRIKEEILKYKGKKENVRS